MSLRGRPILLITCMILLITRMITDRIGLNSALLPLLICSVVVSRPVVDATSRANNSSVVFVFSRWSLRVPRTRRRIR